MHITKQSVIIGVVGVVVGAAAILGIRFFTYSPEKVHYHANFGVYINGQRETFSSPFYYEEEAGSVCAEETEMTPGERAHMHDNIGDVVHVEDHAVTWGQFFQNLGWVVNDELIQTGDKLYQADATHKASFLINNREVQDITSEVIGDKDRVLIDFGDTDKATLKQEFKAIPSTADEYNKGKDPAGCMSNSTPGMQERMRHLF